ncbi:MAG: RNA 2',3'-cyclic phosphodiesterase [Candidatus Limnocylindria bacterium]
MIRLFVAVTLPLPVSEQLAALVPADLKGLKRVRPEFMHVTLAFIGWLDETRVGQVASAAQVAAAKARPFDIPLEAVGRFPPTGRPRVVWVATGAVEEPILALGGIVRDALAEAAIPFDVKPLRPHITLARVREDVALEDGRAIGSAIARARVPAGLHFRADAIDVMQSVLTPKGPRYSTRAHCPLQGGG